MISGNMDDPDRTLNAREAAKLLGVNYRLVLIEAEAGRLPARRIGRSWRFSERALRAWLRREEPPANT
jgi:excisionase family DNA binding protein